MPPYSPIVLDHFHHPRGAGRLADADLVGEAGVLGRGNFLRLFLRLSRPEGSELARVEAAGFQTYGCCPAIAAGSLLAERIPGLTRAEAARWNAAAIEAALGGLPSHKLHCARLAAEALASALAAWAAREAPAFAADRGEPPARDGGPSGGGEGAAPATAAAPLPPRADRTPTDNHTTLHPPAAPRASA